MADSNKKQHIRDTTAALISRNGFHQVRTAAIAEACQVSDTLIFKYYGKLDNLYKEICEHCCGGFSNFSMDAHITSDKEFLEVFLKKFLEKNLAESQNILLYLRVLTEKPEYLKLIPNNAIESGVMLELRYRFITFYGEQAGEFYFDLLWKYLLMQIIEFHFTPQKNSLTPAEIAGHCKQIFF